MTKIDNKRKQDQSVIRYKKLCAEAGIVMDVTVERSTVLTIVRDKVFPKAKFVRDLMLNWDRKIGEKLEGS